MLDYLAKARPNLSAARAPWYKNTAPTYAGIFLWVVFYMNLAENTVDRAGIGVCLLALVVAGLLSYKLYYYVPAMLGMKTGYPLYIVGSSTFGTAGGYLMPGLLMGLLQIGWFAVGTFVATKFILSGVGIDGGNRAPPLRGRGHHLGLHHGVRRREGVQYVSRDLAVPERDLRRDGARGSVQNLGMGSAVYYPGRKTTVGGGLAPDRGGNRLLRHCGGRRRGFRNEQPRRKGRQHRRLVGVALAILVPEDCRSWPWPARMAWTRP